MEMNCSRWQIYASKNAMQRTLWLNLQWGFPNASSFKQDTTNIKINHEQNGDDVLYLETIFYMRKWNYNRKNQGKWQDYGIFLDSSFGLTSLSFSPAASNAENTSTAIISDHCQMQNYGFKVNLRGIKYKGHTNNNRKLAHNSQKNHIECNRQLCIFI